MSTLGQPSFKYNVDQRVTHTLDCSHGDQGVLGGDTADAVPLPVRH